MHFFSAIQAGLMAMIAVSAAPARYAVRDAVAPPITYPTADTVWTGGQQSHVDWDTSSLPPYKNITNTEGMIVLGYEDDCDPNGGEHLDLDHPLAQGFNITLGTIPVTVPDVQPRSDYILVLLGNSGNASPKFTINAKKSVRIHSPSGAPPPARLACSPSSTSTTSASLTSVESATLSSTSAETAASSSDTQASSTIPLASTTVSPAQSTSVASSSVFNTSSGSSTATTSATALAASSSPTTTVSQSAAGSASTSRAASSSAKWTPVALAAFMTLLTFVI